jgi:hypothetical protein
MPTAWSSPMIVTTEVWDPTTRQHFAQQQPFKPAKTTRPGVIRTHDQGIMSGDEPEE